MQSTNFDDINSSILWCMLFGYGYDQVNKQNKRALVFWYFGCFRRRRVEEETETLRESKGDRETDVRNATTYAA